MRGAISARTEAAALETSLDRYLQQRVVIDTSTPMLYIGRLEAHGAAGYWLTEADVHDRSDGHSTKEMYVSAAHDLERSGTRRVNRRRVFVERHAVVSVSALADVVVEELDEERE